MKSRSLMELFQLSERERIFTGYLKGDGIEIGALNHPMAVPMGAKVQYVDRFDKETLRRHYPEINNLNIVDIDVIACVETLDAAFPKSSLDFVIANHIIEHIIDPLGALMKIHTVLRVGGILHLAVPDKRATFDRDRPRTTLSHCIQDHLVGDDNEQTKREILHYQEWVEKAPKYYPEQEKEYQTNFDLLWKERYSIHLHVWEPDDWPEIINYLSKNNYPYSLVDYSNVSCPEFRNEFVLILRKEADSVAPLPATLPEKGPAKWYITRAFVRLFLRPLKPFLRPLVRFLVNSPATDVSSGICKGK